MLRFLNILFLLTSLNGISINIDSLKLVANDKSQPLEKIQRSADLLFKLFKDKNDFKQAYEYYLIYSKAYDSLADIEIKKATIKNQLKYDYEKKATSDSIKNAERGVQDNLKHEAAITHQKSYTYAGLLGFALMLLIAAISYRAFSNKKKTIEQISAQKKIVELQRKEVDEKQKEILDSIHYAKRIQTALITSEKYIDKNLNRLTSKAYSKRAK